MLFTAVFAVAPLAGAGVADPVFATVPFDAWFQQAGQTRFKWSERVLAAELTVHQRLLAQVEVTLDGVELARRRGQGQMLIFCQLTDSSGVTWQDHGAIDLEKVEQGIRASDINFTESAFVMPGDYAVAVAIFDTATNEHAVRRDKLHVAALPNDPLPQAWKGLPAIEFMPQAEAPDSWFLPDIKGRLNLPLPGARPSRIELLVNLTPSERASGSFRVRDRNLGALLPSIKAISEMDAPGVTMGLSLLDLTRRRVAFRQEQIAPELDWPKMRDALTENTPGSVDVKALEDRQHNAAFFVAETGRLLAPSRALIILSSPVEFEGGQDLQPIKMSAPRNCQVFYIRYQPVRSGMMTVSMGPAVRRARSPMVGPNFGMRPSLPPPINDQLFNTLKPLGPRLFDVHTPEQFRRALATIMAELADK